MHQHTDIRDRSVKLLGMSFGLFLFQGSFAYLTGSLVLLTDTLHLLGDNLVIVLTIITQVVVNHNCTEEPGVDTYHRLELMLSKIVGIILIIGGFYLGYEALVRLKNPPQISSIVMIPGVVGLLGNLLLIKFSPVSNGHLAVKGMVAHFKADLFGSMGIILTGVLIWITHRAIFDPLISFLIVLQTFKLGYELLHATITQSRKNH